jgi:hypothetical protein
MSPQTIFAVQSVLGYLAWLLCFGAYVWPRLNSMDLVTAQTRHRYSAQLPLLRARRHPSRRGRPQSAP